ncbi:hypothetical protein [Candidatus Gromoviella agglomerans]|uniref:hypothetical protein n=1 Tax=Candidatus Gromoviella agglomerans TaxID=2806609 RepID=UPI001E45F0A2|nr:hypothetical protein [Candidatus Gromoviella agglomerans]
MKVLFLLAFVVSILLHNDHTLSKKGMIRDKYNVQENVAEIILKAKYFISVKKYRAAIKILNKAKDLVSIGSEMSIPVMQMLIIANSYLLNDHSISVDYAEKLIDSVNEYVYMFQLNDNVSIEDMQQMEDIKRRACKFMSNHYICVANEYIREGNYISAIKNAQQAISVSDDANCRRQSISIISYCMKKLKLNSDVGVLLKEKLN